MAAEYEASGLSQEAFGRQRDIPMKTLARYVGRYRKEKAAAGSEPQRWVAVEISGTDARGSELAVLVSSGRRIEVKPGFDSDTLRQLMAVLEQA